MLDDLFPATVRVVWTTDAHVAVDLSPAERRSVQRAVAGRRAEFETVRACARAALEGLGLTPAPLPNGATGAPQWPRGVVGSLSHCDGLRVAVVARAYDLRTVGVDVEPDLPLPDGVLEEIEPRTGASYDGHGRLLFCAKEAALKAWCQLSGEVVALREIAVAIAPDGSLTAAVRGDAHALPPLTGRWRVQDGFVVASAFREA